MTSGQSLFIPVGILDSPPPSLVVMVFLGQTLPVEVDSFAILPLSNLGSYPTRIHPGSPDTAVDVLHHFGRDSDLEISACPGVGSPPLGGKVDGQAFQCGLRLGNQKDIH